jgi:hypothetical protein
MIKRINCPLCNSDTMKVIYYGLPVKFCCKENCNCMFGFWTNVTNFLPFNGVLFTYEGSYLTALWHWLVGNKED